MRLWFNVHQAGRYQGTLLKSVKEQVFRQGHKPEPYYTSSFAFYRFEVLIRRLTGDDRKIRPFKFLLLLAFRHRYEMENYPGSTNKKVGIYFQVIDEILNNSIKTKEAFDECKQIIEDALDALKLPYERDSAKLRSLIDETKRIARHRNPAIGDNDQQIT